MLNFSDLEKDKLQILLNDELLLAIIYKVFQQATEVNKPKVNEVDDNALLGEKFRGYELSKKIINSAFDILQSHKLEKPDKRPNSRAR